MKHLQPPPYLATWLLKRLVSGPKRESLFGDLIEQHRNGRSASWYWRQVFIAIVAGALRDLGDHKLLAIGAVLTGYAAFAVLYFAGHAVSDALGKSVWNWTVEHGFTSLRVWWFRYELPRALIVVASCLGSGWIVARMNRNRPASMVTAFVLFVLLNNLYSLGQLSVAAERSRVPPRAPLRVVYLPVRGALAVDLQAAAFFILMPTCILLGGLWGVSRHSSRDGELA